MIKNFFDGLTYYTGTNYAAYYIYGNARTLIQPLIGPGENISKISNQTDLYISDLATAHNKELLKEIGITHVVDAVLGCNPPFPEDFSYKYLPVRDIDYEDISIYFDDTSKFIDDAIKNNGKVLVHCMFGASRSATMVAAYIIYKGKGKVTAEQAIKYLKNKREAVRPNSAFVYQLQEYHKTIKNRAENGEEVDESSSSSSNDASSDDEMINESSRL